jgi:imidazolonepropionase-like amidohydrolase
VIVANGKISAVGPATLAHEGMDVRDFGPDSTITPGLIDSCASSIELAGGDSEDGEEVLPLIRVADGLDPENPQWQVLQGFGVTTVYVTPSGRSVIGGRGAVTKTRPGEGSLLVARSQMKATMGGEPSANNLTPRFGRPRSMFYRRPTTRMGVTWIFRKAFFDAQKYRKELAAGEVQRDPAMDALVDVLEGRVKLRARARLLQDIRAAMRLTSEFGMKVVIEEAAEAFRCLDELREGKAFVIYGPIFLGNASVQYGFGYSGGGGRSSETDRTNLTTAARLNEAGVPFALTAAEYGTSGDGFPGQIALAVHFGLPKDAALKACTATPARLLGIADRVGTLEQGKDADLVVWNGEAFEFSSRPTFVMIDGQFVAEQE